MYVNIYKVWMDGWMDGWVVAGMEREASRCESSSVGEMWMDAKLNSSLLDSAADESSPEMESTDPLRRAAKGHILFFSMQACATSLEIHRSHQEPAIDEKSNPFPFGCPTLSGKNSTKQLRYQII